MVPPAGIPAQFAFNFEGIQTFLMPVCVPVGITGSLRKSKMSPSGRADGRYDGLGHRRDKAPADRPYVVLPTACGARRNSPLKCSAPAQEQNARPKSLTRLYSTEEGVPTGFTGCERLAQLQPKSRAPDTSYADTPAGLTVDLRMPQGVNPEELPTAGLKNTTVTLPEGVAINPGQATGLEACQPSQEGRGPEGLGSETDEEPPSCPSASKVGTDEIETPLIGEKLKGNLYVLSSDPPHLQLLLSASGAGVNLKLIGDVELDPLTGRLTGTCKETPDRRFTDFKLAFSGGARAAIGYADEMRRVWEPRGIRAVEHPVRL